jgi:predicted RND superfamily exporter protein
MAKRYAQFILKYPVIILFIIAIITIFFAYETQKVKLYFDPDDLLPQDHPYIVLKNKMEEVFGGSNITVVGIVRKEGNIYNPETLGKINRITDKILDMDGVIPAKVVSIAARKVKDIRGTEEGMEVKRMMREIPSDPAEISRIRDAVFRNDLYLGTLVSHDGKAAAILADFTEDTYTVDIGRQILKIIKEEEDGNTSLHFGGITAHMYWIDYYSRYMPLFFFCALIVILSLLYIAFRSIRGMILPILAAGISVTWALGAMGLVEFPMDGFNSMAPILIMGVAASHSVQILKRYYEEFSQTRDNKTSCFNATAFISSAAFSAIATDAAGFATLAIFPLRTIRGFGLYTSFGLASILITSLTLIPCLLSLLPAPKKSPAGENAGGLLQKLLTLLGRAFLGRHRYVLALVLITVMAFGIWGTFLVHTESNFTTVFKKNTRLRKDDTVLNGIFSGTTTFNILIEGKEQDSIKEPRILKAIEGLQHFLEKKSFVGDTWSIVDYLKKMNKAMHADDPAFEKLPENRNLIFQYLLLYSMGGDPEDFDHVVDYEYRQAVIQVFSRDYSTNAAYELIRDSKKYVAENFPKDYYIGIASGTSAVSAALNDVMVKGQVRSIIQVSIVVFLLCSLIFRSWIGGLLAITPMSFAVVLNFGVMGFAGIYLSIATATIAAMGIGIGVDYAIYIISRFKEEFKKTKDIHQTMTETMLHTGKAVVFIATSIAAGYLTLIFSGLIYHLHIGVLVALIMITSLLGAVTLLPALIVWTKPKFIFGHKHD